MNPLREMPANLKPKLNMRKIHRWLGLPAAIFLILTSITGVWLEGVKFFGAEETERMLALLTRLKTTHAILLVEHDMDAVFRIADRITVMVNGTVIATGDPAAIRANPEVRSAYLGEGH